MMNAEKFLSRDELIADIRYLANMIETVHPDPYINQGGKIAFHRRLHELILKLPSTGMSVRKFYRYLLPFVAAIKDAHTFLYPLYKDQKAGIPFKFDVVDNCLYISGVYFDMHRHLIGSKLLAIEDVDLSSLLEKQTTLRGCENPYGVLVSLTYCLQNYHALINLLPEIEHKQRVRIKVELPSGVMKEVEVEILPHITYDTMLMAPTRVNLPQLADFSDIGYGFMDKHKRIAILRIDGMIFYRENLTSCKQWMDFVLPKIAKSYEKKFKRPAPKNKEELIAIVPWVTDIFKNFFTEMKAAKTDTLIIDVRKNTGGNSLLADILMYFLYGKEAIFVPSMIVKYSKLYFDTYKEQKLSEINKNRPFQLTETDYDFVDFKEFKGYCNKAVDKRSQLVDVAYFGKIYKSGKYSGYYCPKNVFVLTSARTASSGYYLMASLYKKGAILVGVPSCQSGNGFGETLSFILPNSKIRVGVSSMVFLFFPDDTEKGKILRPHYELTYDKLKTYQFDPNSELRLALELIGQTSE